MTQSDRDVATFMIFTTLGVVLFAVAWISYVAISAWIASSGEPSALRWPG